VRVTKCDIECDDDCISIKSGRDADGRRVNRPSEDIVIEGCRFGYGHGAVALGSETAGGIRNVVVRDCTVEDDNWAAIRFKTAPSRGGVVENVTFRDIRLRDVRRAFEMNMIWANKEKPPADPLPVFRDVRFINVSGTAKSGGIMLGLKDSPIRNVVFENCKVDAQTGLLLDRAEQVDVSGLELTVKEGRAVVWKVAK
jgi:hypothetical protein